MASIVSHLPVTSRDVKIHGVYEELRLTVHTWRVTSLPFLPTYLITVCRQAVMGRKISLASHVWQMSQSSIFGSRLCQ